MKMRVEKPAQRSVAECVEYHGTRDALLKRAQSIYASLEDHHGKTGGLTPAVVASHFEDVGSAMFEALDRNGDGEIDEQVREGTGL